MLSLVREWIGKLSGKFIEITKGLLKFWEDKILGESMNFNYNVKTLLTKVEGLLIKDLHNKKVYNKEVAEFNTKVENFNRESKEEYENLVAYHQKTLQEIGDDKLIEDLTEENVHFYETESFWGVKVDSYIRRELKSCYYEDVPYMKGLLVMRSHPHAGYNNPSYREPIPLQHCSFVTEVDDGKRLAPHIERFYIALPEVAKKMHSIPFETEQPNKHLTKLKEKLLKLKSLGVEEVTLDDKDLELICGTDSSPKKCLVFEELLEEKYSGIRVSTIF